MEGECGEEWVKKIRSIVTEFDKSRKDTLEKRKAATDKGQDKAEMLPLLMDEADWPYDSSQQKASLNPELMEMAQRFE